jgi:hypothetical protein
LEIGILNKEEDDAYSWLCDEADPRTVDVSTRRSDGMHVMNIPQGEGQAEVTTAHLPAE